MPFEDGGRSARDSIERIARRRGASKTRVPDTRRRPELKPLLFALNLCSLGWASLRGPHGSFRSAWCSLAGTKRSEANRTVPFFCSRLIGAKTISGFFCRVTTAFRGRFYEPRTVDFVKS